MQIPCSLANYSTVTDLGLPSNPFETMESRALRGALKRGVFSSSTRVQDFSLG